ncbi:hypothetical protein JCM4814A_38120 [Streptomyces phaeofaciens JCM 4814]|uniref:UL36 very large tegument protein n=1 Tax=Streptomyces phaeofaciens TaxID=68254 RepID=A0A918HEA6_9ACTN|nr:hypothetical protein [Streptomyces phaeofaciens]GGT58358.1 hypothetical protein GCM10010226_39450 [Streptomyces phaeofaciens]
MTLDQLPGRVREFANYLNGLLARLDQGAGWCAVFWQRDPDGMRACLDGREVPPWDVVEALLQDLATEHGTPAAAQEAQRVRPLHGAALAAHDARPGGRDALGDRLDVMLREQRYAVERQAELGRRLSAAGTREEADALRLDLAWAHDDHERATARCTELRYRIAEFDRRAAARRQAREHGPAEPGPTVAAYDNRAPGGGPGAAGDPERAREPRIEPEPDTPASVPKQRKRRRGGARFAGMVEEETAPVAEPPAPEPSAPRAPAPTGRRSPRGARFAGAAAETVEQRSEPRREPLGAEARRETVEAVERLVALRAEGRSGEAHALLVECAHWPAARIPLLAAELQRAGLSADWTTLLWETASLPADRLVAAADALAAVGRTADGEQILRQGVARPAAEIGQAVLALVEVGRHREVRALLDAYVRVRTPEEAARSVAPDPRSLVPLLLEAARGVSDQRHWDLVHALRVAGLTT